MSISVCQMLSATLNLFWCSITTHYYVQIGGKIPRFLRQFCKLLAVDSSLTQNYRARVRRLWLLLPTVRGISAFRHTVWHFESNYWYYFGTIPYFLWKWQKNQNQKIAGQRGSRHAPANWLRTLSAPIIQPSLLTLLCSGSEELAADISGAPVTKEDVVRVMSLYSQHFVIFTFPAYPFCPL